MKNYIKSAMIIFLLTIGIMFSYTVFPVSQESVSHFFGFLNGNKINIESVFRKGMKEIRESEENPLSKTKKKDYRAVWITYQEINAYRNSVDENNASNFRTFFRSMLSRLDQLGINTVIVQVRPYADALYPSKYFPWSAYISGDQGQNPGYDPLKIMVKEAHSFNMSIEAWINPYRIAFSDQIESLAKENIARQWAETEEYERNVLSYDGALYFNPSSKDVRDLIAHGVEEIVDNYDVDAIHMDDYFYPIFTEENYASVFDAPEYEQYTYDTEDAMSIVDWRRQQVNLLVKDIYKTVHKRGKRFGISPAGNLDNLRSDYEYYVDIDAWMSEKGYVDYIMPQLYWGFSNELAPFEDVLNRWEKLAKGSKVDLYVGLQLYKLGTDDETQTDYKELQSGDFVKHQIVFLGKKKPVKGYSLFSYQYLDVYNETYQYETYNFNEYRKEVLAENVDNLKE